MHSPVIKFDTIPKSSHRKQHVLSQIKDFNALKRVLQYQDESPQP